MTSFTDVFGGSTLQAAQVAYRAVALTANLATKWPPYATADNYLARLMDVSPSASGLSISLPDATLSGPGQDTFVNNRGGFAFNLLDFAGGVVAVVAPGTVRYVYLTNSVAPAGVWVSIVFGVGASLLDASQLAGLGLKAINNTLAQAPVTSTFAGSTTVTALDRAKVFVWIGGTGVLTLPALATVGNDFVIEVRDQGAGVLSIATNGSESIDGSLTLQLQLGESCIIHAGVAGWYTVGRGRNTQFNFTQLIKSVSGGTDTLSLTEAANVVQTYTGTLLTNEVVVLPAVVQVYYVSNQTSGAFNFQFKSPTTGATVAIPTGQNAVLFCDGVNVINASTTLAGISSLVLASGSAASPSLGVGASNTGIFSPASNTLGVSVNSAQIAQFDPTGFQVSAVAAAAASVVSTGSNAFQIIDRPNGSSGALFYRTLGLNRWVMAASTLSESGANAGSDLIVQAYNDAGTALGVVYTIIRATQVVAFNQAPTFGAPLAVGSGGTGGATTGAAALALAMEGSNQFWQDVKAFRALATNFTNTSGQPIQVSIVALVPSAASGVLTVSSLQISTFNNPTGSPQTYTFQARIPTGAVYRLDNATSITAWSECRV